MQKMKLNFRASDTYFRKLLDWTPQRRDWMLKIPDLHNICAIFPDGAFNSAHSQSSTFLWPISVL
ncbi:hypothetical protein SBA5_330078 [Candidatus Sulfotelmatomonas gaucii]|uniref:Uncharacterized protein n=1 Tax=Candidatus Sulfuritelmatomonas gaucii TaxID=2043161 RepID=A0A2N9LFK2_9BACT|nr:hypothetical protein SBA5_330078 [Candidatus Sulfotelmatomonas gaucii]